MKDFPIGPGTRALIFDCDGTLVDSMPLHMKAWEAALRHFKTPFDEEYLFSLKGMKETDIVELYNKKSGTSLDPVEVVALKQKYISNHIRTVNPVTPVAEVAKKYFGIMPMAVVSGSARKIVTAELKVIGILKLFDIILTADDPYKPKPASEIFFAAASKMQVETRYCLVFEDGDAGLKAASAAGMKTIDVREYL